jgi:hypothetical protein
MTPDAQRTIDETLAHLPLDDRMFALIACIVERKPQATRAVVSLIAAVTAMAGVLDAAERIAIAEILRDSADRVEQRRERVPIV